MSTGADWARGVMLTDDQDARAGALIGSTDALERCGAWQAPEEL